MKAERERKLILALIAALIVLLIMGFFTKPKAATPVKLAVASVGLFNCLDEYDIEPEPESVIDDDFIFFDVPQWQTYVATAYCACEKCCGYWATTVDAGKTASGAKATEGVTVAMDPSIPFGTRIYIEGIGERICQDRGSAIIGNRIDVYFESHEDALQFGMPTVNVIFLEN